MSERTEQVAQDYCDHMMEKANVVGTAGGDDKVLVLVTRKQPLSALASEDVVDREVDGLQTDVIEVGVIEPMLQAGASIGNHTTGTLGGFVEDEHGHVYALTNNHVAAASNEARVLTPIHSPGPHDGLGDQIGVLGRFEPIFFDRPNLIDAALVRLQDDANYEVTFHGTTTTGRVGWTVSKTGRTSGYTEGQIIGRNATIDVYFGEELGTARFTGQIITSYMLSPGDSGSVLLSTSGHPVALGFAGSSEISIHTPINLVLRTLAVRFVNED